MIRIKAVDEQNIMDVCELTSYQSCTGAPAMCRLYCNAISIAETKYNPELHPNAIYSNNALIGFFMYERSEEKAETAIICRFMLDDRFRNMGLEEQAFAHVLRGLKIQGVKKVISIADGADEDLKELYLPFGFHPAGGTSRAVSRYELEL